MTAGKRIDVLPKSQFDWIAEALFLFDHLGHDAVKVMTGVASRPLCTS
jgi:hypothetical protein